MKTAKMVFEQLINLLCYIVPSYHDGMLCASDTAISEGTKGKGRGLKKEFGGGNG